MTAETACSRSVSKLLALKYTHRFGGPQFEYITRGPAPHLPGPSAGRVRYKSHHPVAWALQATALSICMYVCMYCYMEVQHRLNVPSASKMRVPVAWQGASTACAGARYKVEAAANVYFRKAMGVSWRRGRLEKSARGAGPGGREQECKVGNGWMKGRKWQACSVQCTRGWALKAGVSAVGRQRQQASCRYERRGSK